MLGEEARYLRCHRQHFSFPGVICILKLPGALAFQSFFILFLRCLQLYLIGKETPLRYNVLLVCQDRKATAEIMPLPLFLLKLKNRCQSSLKGFLTLFPSCLSRWRTTCQNVEASCFREIKLASALADRGKINHFL